jgi:hypothetical protein
MLTKKLFIDIILEFLFIMGTRKPIDINININMR